MKLQPLDYKLTVCKLGSLSMVPTDDDFFFVGKTDEELSLVCKTERVPPATMAREDGWRAFRIVGELDFSLIGILSKLSAVLAGRGIGIFAVSTFNTDYILVKEERFDEALRALAAEGYELVEAAVVS